MIMTVMILAVVNFYDDEMSIMIMMMIDFRDDADMMMKKVKEIMIMIDNR